ncbi:MAG: malonyl-ACP O-methyltransferase BioC [Sulfurifustaceae bacterium]
MLTGAKPFDYDKRRLRAQFERAAVSYDSAAVLARTVADRLIERLDVVRLVPQRALDAGCGTGYCTRALARRYRAAQVVGIDLAFAMVSEARRKAGWFSRSRFVSGDVERLPFADASFGLVSANFALTWSDPAIAFTELLRVLQPDGLLVFTTLGPDTLSELREAWRTVDETAHVHTFLDMHDIGDALVHAGFADPVMDVERYTLTYPDVPAVLRDLKALGVQNADPARRRGLTGRKRFQRFQSAYEACAEHGRIPATYEVVYGHAWAPAQRRTADGAVRIPIGRIGRRR